MEANRELRQRLKDSGQARQEDYQQVKRFMTDSTLSETERVKAATAYVDERTAHSPPPTVEALTDLDTPLQAAGHVSANPPRPLAPVITNLVEANRELRQRLKDSGQARQEDYKQVKRFMTDSTLSKTERVKAATAYVDERTAHSPPPTVEALTDLDTPLQAAGHVSANPPRPLAPVITNLVEANRELRQRLKDSGQARQEDYKQVKRFMTDSTLSKTERVKAATAYVEERTAHSPPPKVADLVDLSKEVSEPIRYLNAPATLIPVIEELVGEKEKRQQAESAARAAKQRVEAVEKALPETGWTMPRVNVKKESKIFGPDQRVETETATLYRQRVGQDIDLYLAKQRKADRAALEEEEKQVREQATAAAKTNVQQELPTPAGSGDRVSGVTNRAPGTERNE